MVAKTIKRTRVGRETHELERTLNSFPDNSFPGNSFPGNSFPGRIVCVPSLACAYTDDDDDQAERAHVAFGNDGRSIVVQSIGAFRI